ncbi:MAG: type II toxin-antitoxin system VapC family toxin [Polyangiaceae bacterium]
MIAPYLDSSAIIYLVEAVAAAQHLVAQHVAAAEGAANGRIITSELARLECRVKPMRTGDAPLLATYDAFFTRARLQLVIIDAAAIDLATELRARYGFKTPDAIHLASAIVAGADVFITGDASLARCKEIAVEVVSPMR